jgi:hypothetical protein
LENEYISEDELASEKSDLDDLFSRKTKPFRNSDPVNYTLETYKTVAKNFYNDLDQDTNMYAGVCNVCGMVKFQNEMSSLKITLSKKELGVINGCLLNEKFGSYTVCYSCRQSLSKSNIPKMSLRNMGKLPTSQPDCLKCLTMAERIMLSPARAFITIKRLQLGSFASTGNSIGLNQRFTSVVKSLPGHPDKLPENIIYVLVKKDKSYEEDDVEPYKNNFPELRVRRNVWKTAFLYLKDTNPVFSDIKLDEQNLMCYPEDSIPTELLNSIKIVTDKNMQNHDLGHQQILDELETNQTTIKSKYIIFLTKERRLKIAM